MKQTTLPSKGRSGMNKDLNLRGTLQNCLGNILCFVSGKSTVTTSWSFLHFQPWGEGPIHTLIFLCVHLRYLKCAFKNVKCGYGKHMFVLFIYNTHQRMWMVVVSCWIPALVANLNLFKVIGILPLRNHERAFYLLELHANKIAAIHYNGSTHPKVCYQAVITGQ